MSGSANGKALVYFAIVPEWLLDERISDRAVHLYARLGRFANRDGFARPPRKLLAQKLRCSPKSIDRAMSELVDVGAVTVHMRVENNMRLPNGYTLHRAPTRLFPRGGRATRVPTPLDRAVAGVASPVSKGPEPSNENQPTHPTST